MRAPEIVMRAPEDVHPLFKDTSTDHLIQVVDAPIRENFYHILHSQPDEAFLKDVDAGKKVGFVCVNNVWTLYACGKTDLNRFTATVKVGQIVVQKDIEKFNAIAKKYPRGNIGIQEKADRIALEWMARYLAAEVNMPQGCIKEEDASERTVKILVCNAQHPGFVTPPEKPEEAAVYSKRFQQLINVIKKVKGPDIYTFSEVHPTMEQYIKDSFDPAEYHIVEQTYVVSLKVSLVTVLKKATVSNVECSAARVVSGRVQSLLCTLADTKEQFVLHAAHLPHQGNNMRLAEKIIINEIFSRKENSLYPQILTGDLNITLQVQDNEKRNIATSVVPEAIIKRMPPLFNGKPIYRWDRTLGTLTLPRLKEDAKSPSTQLNFHRARQCIDVASHVPINPQNGFTHSPGYEKPSALEGEFRLFSRFGKKYRERVLSPFYQMHSTSAPHQEERSSLFERYPVLGKMFLQQEGDVEVYQSGDQDNANFELVFNISNGIWNKLKPFLDSDLFQCRYSIQYNGPGKQVLEEVADGKQVVLACISNEWILYAGGKQGHSVTKKIVVLEDIDVLNNIAKKYPIKASEIQDDVDKAALEKIVTSLGGVTRQIDVAEHSTGAFLICRGSQIWGRAVVEAMTFLVDEQYQPFFTLEAAVKKQGCHCEWIKEKDVFYIQFSFANRGQLISKYLEGYFAFPGGGIVNGDKFKIPMGKIGKNMASSLNFFIEMASCITDINKRCHGLLTIAFHAGILIKSGNFNITFSSKVVSQIVFKTLKPYIKEISDLGKRDRNFSMGIGYDNFSTESGSVEKTLSKILVDSIAGIVDRLPYQIKPSSTVKNAIVSKKALPHALSQDFKLIQGKVTQSYFFYTRAPGCSYADIAIALYQDATKLMNDILTELNNYTGENKAYKELQGFVKKMNANPNLILLTIGQALEKHCGDKIKFSKDAPKSSFLWSAPKSDKYTDLLHNSLIQANFLANLEFNYQVADRIQTLQRLINTQEKRELFELCGKERKCDSGEPYNNIRKNSALLLLEQHLILSHPEYTAHDVWEHIKRKSVEYYGTGKNYLRESDGGELRLGEILTSVKKIGSALSLLVTSNDVTTHARETLSK